MSHLPPPPAHALRGALSKGPANLKSASPTSPETPPVLRIGLGHGTEGEQALTPTDPGSSPGSAADRCCDHQPLASLTNANDSGRVAASRVPGEKTVRHTRNISQHALSSGVVPSTALGTGLV